MSKRLYTLYILAKYRSFQRAIRGLTWDLHKLGYIQRPSRCDSCGKIKHLEMHHTDYTKPLDIVWLCKTCHSLDHCVLQSYEKILSDIGLPLLSYADWLALNKPKGDRPLAKAIIVQCLLKSLPNS